MISLKQNEARNPEKTLKKPQIYKDAPCTNVLAAQIKVQSAFQKLESVQLDMIDR